jgi:hypothetical protein
MHLPIRPALARLLAAALLCLLLAASPAAAESAPLAPGADVPAAGASGPPAAAVPLASVWNTAYSKIEGCLKTRAGLLQIGAIGMVVALFVIMFNNKWSK